jgi:hypothetical protein
MAALGSSIKFRVSGRKVLLDAHAKIKFIASQKVIRGFDK